MADLEYFKRRFICWLLRIERWHAASGMLQPYRQSVVQHARAISPDSVVEFGCGFGEIICQIPARVRLGTDASARVLVGARLCHFREWALKGLQFARLRLGEPLSGVFSCIICVNFAHSVAPDTLKAALSELVHKNLAPGGLLIFDVVEEQPNSISHDPAFLLSDLGFEFEIVSGFSFGRSLVFAQERIDPT